MIDVVVKLKQWITHRRDNLLVSIQRVQEYDYDSLQYSDLNGLGFFFEFMSFAFDCAIESTYVCIKKKPTVFI